MLRGLLSLAAFPLLAQVPDRLIHQQAVAYAHDSPEQVMDIVRPRDGRIHPAIVAVHGGGFRAGSRRGYLPQCVRLAEQGYVCATIDYRLAPKSQFPAAVEDAKSAVRYLRENAAALAIDPKRIGAMGGSAGGHLVLFLGFTGDASTRVQCVVDYYGPTDLTKSYGHSVDAGEVLPLFLGGDLEHTRPAHIRASPINWVTPDAAPVLAIHGTKDRYVQYDQSLWLMDRLHSAGVEAELLTLEGADHGFKGADAEKAEKAMLEFFGRHLLKSGAQ